MKTKIKYSAAVACVIVLTTVHATVAQSIRLDNLKDQFGKGKMFKVGGGLAASGVYYNGNGGYGRNPFSYFVNGNISINVYGLVNLPFTFTLSNLGGNYTYPVPPNRLSLHPSYKWITGHFGNISMTYSPYTLNGYLFSGAGVDLEPEGAVKASAIYGRLQRAVEYDTSNRTVPAAYERLGFATKLQWQKEKYKAGMILFRAWDDPNSIQHKPDSFGIYPMENTVLSINAGARIIKQMDFTIEYAASALTRDIRAETVPGQGILAHVVKSRASTGFYNAIKSQLQYTLQSTVLGVGYERVDPGYQTLGAYYINNDLENITVNAAQPLFNSKVQIAVNAGYQRDNLDGSKSGSSSRAIGSANLSYRPTEKLSTNVNYSNFRTFMRIRPQFQKINQLDNFQNMDTLNYTQISRNANASLSYTLKQSEAVSRTLNFDLSFQATADKQSDVLRNGDGSEFYNAALMYNAAQMQKGISFSGAFNITYNTIGRDNFITLGPTVAFNAKLLKKKMSAGTSLSYNASKTGAAWASQVLNARCNMVYSFLKRHTVNLVLLNQLRSLAAKSTINDTTLTLGYNFIFG